MDGDGFILFLMFCGVFFVLGMGVGLLIVKQNEKEMHDYLRDKEETRKRFLKDVKIYIRNMTVYELERWLNEKP